MLCLCRSVPTPGTETGIEIVHIPDCPIILYEFWTDVKINKVNK